MRNKDRTKPKTWRKVKLGDIANLFMQQVNPKNLGDIVVDHFSIPAFDAGRLPIRESASQIQSNKFVVPKGAVLLSKLNPRIPRVWKPIIQKDIKALASTEFMVFVPKEDIDRDFLYYLFQKRVFLATLAGQAGGTSTSHQRAIPKAVLDSKVEIPTDINEQKRIANILSAFDEKIELNNKINQTLEEMAQTIFKEWFIKFNFPVEFEVKSEKLKVKSLGYKDAGGKIVDSELGKIPAGWKLKRLGEIVNIEYGRGPSTKELKKSGYPVYGANGIIGYHEKYNFEEPQIIIGCRGVVGSLFKTLPKSSITHNSLVIKPAFSEKNYLFSLLKNSNLQSVVGGSAQPQITIKELSQLPVLFAEDKLREKFEEIVENLEQKKLNITYENQALASLRDLLLPKLMSGEILVNSE